MSDQPTPIGNPTDDLYKYYDKPPDGPSNIHTEAYPKPGEKVIHIDRNQVPPEGLNLIITNDNVNTNIPSDRCVPSAPNGPDYSQYCRPYQEMPPPYYAQNPGMSPPYAQAGWNNPYAQAGWNSPYAQAGWNAPYAQAGFNYPQPGFGPQPFMPPGYGGNGLGISFGGNGFGFSIGIGNGGYGGWGGGFDRWHHDRDHDRWRDHHPIAFRPMPMGGGGRGWGRRC